MVRLEERHGRLNVAHDHAAHDGRAAGAFEVYRFQGNGAVLHAGYGITRVVGIAPA